MKPPLSQEEGKNDEVNVLSEEKNYINFDATERAMAAEEEPTKEVDHLSIMNTDIFEKSEDTVSTSGRNMVEPTFFPINLIRNIDQGVQEDGSFVGSENSEYTYEGDMDDDDAATVGSLSEAILKELDSPLVLVEDIDIDEGANVPSSVPSSEPRNVTSSDQKGKLEC